MPDAFDAPTRFYGVWVSNSGRTSLRWSKPLATVAEARAVAKAELDAGTATLGFVVRITADEKKVLDVLPQPAKKIVGHYLDLLAAMENRS